MALSENIINEKRRAVVVNDDPTQLNVLSALLAKAGLDISAFQSAESALLAMGLAAPPALIVTDLYMPGIDGWRFCRLLRSPEYSQFNLTPILVVSATFSGDEPSRITNDLGANAFLSMPVDGQQFIDLVHVLLKGEKAQDALKVLIVEDSKLISKRLLKTFQAHGYLADTASTLQESLTLIWQNTYDIAVLDYHLPDGLGDSLIKELKEKSPDCVCMMMTADPQADLALKWMKMGAAIYLPKPFEPEYLISQCVRVRRERTLMRIQDLLEVRTRQLQESEEKYRGLIQYSSDPIFAFNPDETYRFVNETFARTFGKKPEEIMGKTPHAIFSFAEAEKRLTLVRHVFKTGKKGEIEVKVITATGDERTYLTSADPVKDEQSKIQFVTCLSKDITDRKRMETALESRLVALTRPLEQTQGIDFNDLFDMGVIQKLQDEFSTATGVASIITHPDGTPITRPSNFCRLCNDIIRKTDKGQINCFNSDAVIGRFHPDGPVMQPCMSGGLWDAGAGISVGGRHIANWLIGQVRDETQTEEKMREYARNIAADETAVIEAFREVPAMSQAQFQRVTQALFTMASQLSTMAYQNIQQARFITERKQAEEALYKSQELYENLVESQIDPICRWLPDTTLVYVNNAYCDYFSKTRTELVGTSFNSLLPGETQASIQNVIKRLLSREVNKFNNEEMNFDAQGNKRWMLWAFNPIIDINGKIIEFQSVGRDITERKQAEGALLASRKELTDIIEFLPDATLAIDLHKRIIIWNKAIEKMTGIPAAEMIGKDVSASTIPFYGEARAQMMDFVFADNAELAARYPDITREGDTFIAEVFCNALYQNQGAWVSAKVSPLHDHLGNIIGAIESIRDITERKQAEEELRESESRFKAVSEYSHNAICLIDEGGVIIWVNAAFIQMSGHAEEHLFANASFIDYLAPESVEFVVNNFTKFIKKEPYQHDYSFYFIRADGQKRLCEKHMTDYTDRQGSRILAISMVDVTERKEAEEKIREKDIQFRKLSSNMPDLIFQFTRKPDGTYFVPVASEGIKNIFGCSPEDVLDDFAPIASVIFPEDSSRVISDIEFSAKHLTYFTCEFRVQIPGKAIQWIYSKSTPEKLDDGSITWYGFNADITERKKAEEELRESEGKYKLLNESAGVGIGYYTPDGKVISYNAMAANNMGGKPEDFTGKSIYELFPKMDADVYMGRIQKAIESKDPQEYEDKVDLPGEPMWFASVFTRVLNASSKIIGVQIISTNISARKQGEAKITEQLDELRRWHNITMGREERIYQLKREVNQLLTADGKPTRYASAVDEPQV